MTVHHDIPFLEEEQMGTEANKAVMKQFVDHTKAGRGDDVDAMFQGDAVHHGPAGAQLAVEANRAALERYRTHGADYQLADMMAEGDRVALWLVNRGKQTVRM